MNVVLSLPEEILLFGLNDKEERRDARKRMAEIAKPLPVTQAINEAMEQ